MSVYDMIHEANDVRKGATAQWGTENNWCDTQDISLNLVLKSMQKDV